MVCHQTWTLQTALSACVIATLRSWTALGLNDPFHLQAHCIPTAKTAVGGHGETLAPFCRYSMTS